MGIRCVRVAPLDTVHQPHEGTVFIEQLNTHNMMALFYRMLVAWLWGLVLPRARVVSVLGPQTPGTTPAHAVCGGSDSRWFPSLCPTTAFVADIPRG